jgi:hypothetical protein
LRYCRSRVFTFVFFMQKLKGISSGQNNKSCSIIHNRSNKIGSHFSEFSLILYAIYKNQPTHFSYWRCAFAVRPLTRTVPSQCGPQARWPARGAQIPARSRRSPAGEGGGAVYGSLWIGLGARLVGRCRRWAAHRQPGGTGRRSWPSRR